MLSKSNDWHDFAAKNTTVQEDARTKQKYTKYTNKVLMLAILESIFCKNIQSSFSRNLHNSSHDKEVFHMTSNASSAVYSILSANLTSWYWSSWLAIIMLPPQHQAATTGLSSIKKKTCISHFQMKTAKLKENVPKKVSQNGWGVFWNCIWLIYYTICRYSVSS